jgi:hypothetical protein
VDHAEELLQRYLDGLAGPAELAQLGRLLAERPDLAETLAEVCRTEVLLATHFHERRSRVRAEALLAGPLPVPVVAGRLGPPAPLPALRRRRWGWWAAGLLFLAASAALGYRLRSGVLPAGGAVLSGRVLVAGVEAALVPDGAPLEVAGDADAVIRLAEGTRAELGPASRAVLRGRGATWDRLVELDRGRATIHTGGRRLQVTTPMGTVRGLDAAFTVELQPDDTEEETMNNRGTLLLVVAALIGQVEVHSAGRDYLLAPGKSWVFAAEGKTFVKPSLGGTIVAISADGKTLTLETPAKKGGTPNRHTVRLTPRTRLEYFGVAPEGKKPTVGYVASVWLAEGGLDAARVRLGHKEMVLHGVVVGVASDGKGFTLEMGKKGGSPVRLEIKLAEGAKLVYQDVKENRPTAGYFARVWLRPGSKDTAGGVVFAATAKGLDGSPKGKGGKKAGTKGAVAKKPSLGGTITAVSADGSVITLQSFARKGGIPLTREVRITRETRIQAGKKGPKLTAGQAVLVWLQEGSKDVAAAVQVALPKGKTAKGDKPIDKPKDEKPKDGKPVEKPKGDKPIEKPKGEKPREGKPKGDKPKDEKPVKEPKGDKPGKVKTGAADKKLENPIPLPVVPARPPRDPAPIAAAIDAEVDRLLKEERIPASPRADDAEFLRRACLDITGRIPTRRRAAAFLDSKDPDKRAKLIDELLASPDYGRHFATLWRNRIVTDDGGVKKGRDIFSPWLADQLNANRGWNAIVADLLTAEGPISNNPQSAFLLANAENFQPQPNQVAGAVAQLFWGVQLRCAECHDHPFAHWKQDDFWGTAAFFGRLRFTGFKGGRTPALEESAEPIAGVGKKGSLAPALALRGTALVIPAGAGKRAGAVVKARFLGGAEPALDESKPLRPAFAAWATNGTNPYFARSAVNRLWAHLFGRGIVHPVDGFDDTNPPTHPELLRRLTQELVASDFDLKHLIRCITRSRAYGRTSRPVAGNERDTTHFSHVAVKVLTPEVFFDALAVVTDVDKGDPWLTAGKGGPGKGKPQSAREEFVRFFRARGGEEPTEYGQGIPQVLRLLNGPLLNGSPAVVARLVETGASRAEALDTLFLTALSRRPTAAEVKALSAYLARRKDAAEGYRGVLWVLLNSSEFALNR